MMGLAICAFPAQALASSPPYAGLDIGYSLIGLQAGGVDEPGVEFASSDRRDTGYAITLGWRFSPQLAAEGTFIEAGEARFDLAAVDGAPVSNATIRVRSSGVVLSLAGNWPLHDSLSLEGRAGAYIGKTETRVRGMATSPLGGRPINSLVGSDSKVGLTAGIAALVAFNETWALRAGYDYLDKAFGKDAGRISLGVRFNWP